MIFENFEYSINEYGNIVIDKYIGESEFVKIPDCINEKPVFEIGHSAFRGMKFITDVVFPKHLKLIGDYAFCECRGIKEFIIPDGLLETGSHCFYNCRALEKIEIPVTVEFIADGFIKNCDGLKEVVIVTNGKLCSGVVDLVTNIDNEIMVIFKNQNARLILPEFGDEYIGNAPAMRFNTLTHGSGAVFRRAFESKGFDYKLYDSFFFRAVLAEKTSTVIKMALCRLMYPYKLDEEGRNGYVKYVSENADKAVEYAAKTGDISVIESMDEFEIFNAENIDDAIDMASKSGNSEISAYLLDVKHKKFGKKKKTFDL
ncbi:MAG: leucine-rich repeat domain-containing protein [Firmicutes bacterium]|nr:leucine-rich repeat domain-containing protein [Bacillota bacterium]